MRTRCLRSFALALMAVSAFMVGGPVADAATLNGHTVNLDASGKIIPWTGDPALGYDTVIDLAWAFMLNDVPLEPNGKPSYYSYSYLNPDTLQAVGWPHNPAGLFAMLTDSALAYYDYTGDERVMVLAREILDHMLANGMTPDSWDWGGVPFASGDAGSLTYGGASYGNQSGVGDGDGVIQPDKLGEIGTAFVRMYQFSGEAVYLEAAIVAADELVEHQRPGNASESPWPFRVYAQSNAIREQYTAHTIAPIKLFDALIDIGAGNVADYAGARQAAWDWLMNFPMQNNLWANYFEDVSIRSSLGNLNQLVALETARYLIEHRDQDPDWESKVRGIITWVENNFVFEAFGANTIAEQMAFFHPMGSHTSRYASVNAMLYDVTGDPEAKENAYRAFNWATYMARPNGRVINGPTVFNIWFTDGYGDYIKHFMAGLGAIPEWVSPGRIGIVRSDSVLRNVLISESIVSYDRARSDSAQRLVLSSAPAGVFADGVPLAESLDVPGWTFDPATGAFDVHHDAAKSIQVVTDGVPGNRPPTVDITSPVGGSMIGIGAEITVSSTASDADGVVEQVEFFVDQLSIGVDDQPPFSVQWTPALSGQHVITARARDDDGATSTSAGVTVVSSSLPRPWLNIDVGGVSAAGSADSDGGVFTVSGSGVDIWDGADSFHFMHASMQGDGEITARVTSLENTDPWALAGVIIREDLTSNSKQVIAAVTPGNGTGLTWRSATGGQSDYDGAGSGSTPEWVRVERRGNTFTAYRSSDGSNWVVIRSVSVNMGQDVYIGLAVTSHDNGVLSTATFESVTATGE